jgi:hypothetical protein
MFNTRLNNSSPWPIPRREAGRSLTWKPIIEKIVTHPISKGRLIVSARAMHEAYGPFVALLREHTFSRPSEGWSAELIAAHVAHTNNRIAHVAEQVLVGESPSYDNRDDIDGAELLAYADSVGGLDGLVLAVETSAARLASAAAALSEDQRERLIRVVIVDGETLVVNELMPIGAFIEGNCAFHLDLHHRQLQILVSD